MSRIRSLHPGLFTDDRYMALSLAARELLKGIWCECDDQGVFEWRPLTLKARILPADAVDVSDLLSELTVGKFVTRFEIGDREFGAVRNFRKYQRPKKPNYTHVLPAEFRTYVGLTDGGSAEDTDKSPPVPHQFPTGGRNHPQMEEGGDKREDVGEEVEKNLPLPERTTRPPRARGAPAPRGRDYAFSGSVIRLTQGDFDRWRASFREIPDLAAELQTIDDKLRDEGFEGKWFGRVSAWLRSRHETLLHDPRKRNGGLLPNEGVF